MRPPKRAAPKGYPSGAPTGKSGCPQECCRDWADGFPDARLVLMTTPAMWYRNRYHSAMAMNLRLPDEAASSLRALSERTGRSQQQLVREAVEEYLRDYELRGFPPEVRHLLTPAARAFEHVAPQPLGDDDITSAQALHDLRADR